jgi:hypothetical protein
VMVINGFGFTDTTDVYFTYPLPHPIHLPGSPQFYLQKAVFSLNSDDQIEVTVPAPPDIFGLTTTPQLWIIGMGYAPYDVGPIQLLP